MTTETWAPASSSSETWTDVRDGANGYVVALYVLPVYVFGTSGVAWSEAADESTTWTPA
jgi:hypothetical protein